jgi:hypothetical protein
MKPNPDMFKAIDELSPAEITILFGETAKLESLDEAYRNQRYSVTRLNGIDQIVVVAQSGRTNHPYALVWLPDGWVASGGGAEAAYEGSGCMLTMCKGARNGTIHGWQAQAKDHIQADPTVLYVWAVGIRLA